LVIPSAAACDGPGSPDEGRIRVVASFYPLAWAAARIGGDAVSVTNLTPPGVEPHDLELSADDLEAIGAADIVLLQGGGFQPAVEDAVAAEATGTVVDVTEGLDLLPASEGRSGRPDPHVWLDPERFGEITDRIGDALAGAGVEDALGNVDLLGDDLAVLDGDIAAGLGSCASRVLVVNHAAFAYLADAYDLEQVAISGVSPEAEPDPARLAEIADLVRTQEVSTIFTETLLPADVAETVAAETGTSTAVLDPLEGLTQERIDAGEDYLSVMRENLAALEQGLRC
jgi:zinc transport system substrate-binding protein